MKSTICSVLLGLGIALLFLATGCQTVIATHTQEIGGPKYPPSDPAQVQILRTEPTRPHVRLGEVRAEPSAESVDATKIEAPYARKRPSWERTLLSWSMTVPRSPAPSSPGHGGGAPFSDSKVAS